MVDSDDRLRFRKVDVLRLARDEVFLRGGLEAGERVCISPLESAIDGMQVRVSVPATPTELALTEAVHSS